MVIDIIFLIFLLAAVLKGWRRGLIVAIFSVLALILGLAAAVKLSAMLAMHLQGSVHVSSKWLPVLSFVIVFLAVVFVVHWIERMLASLIQFALLGWIDKLGGMALYGLVYLAIFSIILFYCTKSGIISHSEMQSSKTYGFMEPFGPFLINHIAALLPLFKDMFVQLENFFASFSHNAS